MTQPETLKYRAFLSYAHADVKWARWLHSKIENFRIDKDLVGRGTPLGAIPARLRPVFRDREDFTGGQALIDATIAALDQSAALVVICSSIAATRPAVNEEVRLFRLRHPGRPIIPVIVDGSPPDNFPPALRFELDQDGRVTDRPVTILGTDLRDNADGRSLGLSKVIAGLIGVGTDEIVRRAERAQRRSTRNWIASLTAVILVFAGIAAWAEINRRLAGKRLQDAERNIGLAKEAANTLLFDVVATLRDTQGLQVDTKSKIVGAVRSVFDTLSDKETADAQLSRNRTLLMYEIAEINAARGYLKEAKEILFNIWLIFSREARDNRGNAEAMLDAAIAGRRLGVMELALGNHKGAMTSFESALQDGASLRKTSPVTVWGEHVALTHVEIARAHRLEGRFDQALRSLLAARDVVEQVANIGPLTNAHKAVIASIQLATGDVLFDKRDNAGALAAYTSALRGLEALAESQPGSVSIQEQLARANAGTCRIINAQGNAAGAVANCRAALDISWRLANADTEDVPRQLTLAASFAALGRTLEAQGSLAGARDNYGKSFGIKFRLANLWVRNAAARSNRALSATEENYRKALDIAKLVLPTELNETSARTSYIALIRQIGEGAANAGGRSLAIAAFTTGRDVAKNATGSKADGEDMRRAMDWFEAQLRKLQP